jgi:hypothetical protein
LNLGGLAARLEIDELPFRLPQLPRGLVNGGPVGDVVLVEERRSTGDFSTSLDKKGCEEPLQGRADLHKVSLSIALPLGRRGNAGLPPPARAGHH